MSRLWLVMCPGRWLMDFSFYIYSIIRTFSFYLFFKGEWVGEGKGGERVGGGGMAYNR